MKIAVAGLGYVGLSNAIVLAHKNTVTGFELKSDKVECLKQGISPISDLDIGGYLTSHSINFKPTSDKEEAYRDADFIIIIATPTDYDPRANCFDTSAVEAAISDILALNSRATIIIKSTVPVGFTERARRLFQYERILFSPEFLREGSALFDSFHPARIIVGQDSKEAKTFDRLLQQAAKSQMFQYY